LACRSARAVNSTQIYVEDRRHHAAGKRRQALAHITSDGLLNLLRMEATVEYVIDQLPVVPPIFQVIQRLGGISDERCTASTIWGSALLCGRRALADDVLNI
jgi:phosphoribosylaminoimidazole (AIR) synthetase